MSQARAELLADVYAVLGGAVPGLSTMELLDALWLAGRLPVGESAPLSAAMASRSASGAFADRPTDQDDVDESAPAGPADGGPSSVPALGLHASPSTTTQVPVGSGPGAVSLRALLVPGPKPLADELVLARALRPLRRLRPGRRGQRLDESATTAAIAETGVIDVRMRSLPEPAWRCALLVDDGLSMRPWEPTVRALEQVLRRSGAFRSVDLFGVDTRSPGMVRLHRGAFSHSRPLNARAPWPPDSHALLLVVSDGVGAAWRDGRMEQRLADWSRDFPTAVVQTLPRRLWGGTGADVTTRTVRTGVVGRPWTASAARSNSQAAPPPVPLVELTPAGLTQLSLLLRSTGPHHAPTLRTGVAAAENFAPPLEPALALARFRDAATPQAYRLAAHVAATAPVPFPVIRLLHAALAPKGRSDPAVVAEVLLGGLLQPVELRSSAGRELGFDLDPEVKNLLLDEVPTAELVRVAHQVADRMRQRTGRTPGFVAWQTTPEPTPHATPAQRLPAPFALLPRPETAPPRVTTTPVEAVHPSWSEDLPRPYFFLSYAHPPRSSRTSGNPSPWEEQLFQDLCEAVAELAGLNDDEPAGFMDSGAHLGEGRAERITEALAHCRVFVPLYSPRYFRSETCGQEWAAFASRQVFPNRPALENTEVSGIVPVQWVVVGHDDLPDVARTLPYAHRDFGEEYVAEGLLSLARLGYFREQYELAVLRLAQTIVRVAQQTTITVGRRRDFQARPNAFKAPDPRRRLRIAVMACDLRNLPTGRSSEFYGNSALDWKPYRDMPDTLARRAASVVGPSEFQPTIHEFEEEAQSLLRGEAPTAPGVLLLDPWSLLDKDRRELLRRFDAQNPTWVSVLVPTPDDDPQSRSRSDELAELVDATVTHMLVERRALTHTTAFDEVLLHGAFSAQQAFDLNR